jgi:hypothetical protein
VVQLGGVSETTSLAVAMGGVSNLTLYTVHGQKKKKMICWFVSDMRNFGLLVLF